MTLPLWRALPLRSIASVEHHSTLRTAVHHLERGPSRRKHVRSQPFVSLPSLQQRPESQENHNTADTSEENRLNDVEVNLGSSLQQQLDTDVQPNPGFRNDTTPDYLQHNETPVDDVRGEGQPVEPVRDIHSNEGNEETGVQSSPIPKSILWAEFTQAQLEHQLRLDTDADKLGRLLRGPLQKYRSDRIQRKTWNMLNREAANPGNLDTSRDAVRLKEDAESHLTGRTATLLRHQISASRDASELERTLRVGLTDDVQRPPPDPESKIAKTIRILSHPWMHKHMVARLNGRGSRRYEVTLMSNILRQIERAEHPAESRLVWSALYVAANAHALEAVQQRMKALGFLFPSGLSAEMDELENRAQLESILSEPSSRNLKVRTAEDLPSNAQLSQLLQALTRGLQEGSAFDGTRNSEGLLAILDSVERRIGRTDASSKISAFSDWRILYPYIWVLAECGAGDKIRGLWDVLWHRQESRQWSKVWTSLASFIVHMLFRAGDPTRAWDLFVTVGPRIAADRETQRSGANHTYVGGIHPSIWRALLAHSSGSRNLPRMSKELNELCQTAFANEYASHLKAMERKMGLEWDSQRGAHDIADTHKWTDFLDSVPPSATKRTRAFPTCGAATCRVLQPHKWPAADPELADAIIHFRARHQCVVDNDSESWKDLPRLLPNIDANHAEHLEMADTASAKNEVPENQRRTSAREAKAAAMRDRRVRDARRARGMRRAV